MTVASSVAPIVPARFAAGPKVRDWARQNGVSDAFDGWVNTGFALGVTPDGRILVGFGAGRTTFQGYMVVLPEPESK